MKHFILRRYPVVFLLAGIVISVVLRPSPVLAQSGELDLLKARLDQLEQRQAALEEENQ